MTCTHCNKRSPEDHRRFFGVIRAAFHHWPEAHEFQPDSEEHLRKWLLIKAGYRDVTTIPVEYADAQPAMLQLVVLTVEAAMKAAGGYAFVRPHGVGLAIFAAKSIKWDTLSQKKFNIVRDAVESVIKAETGLEPDDILKETERAA
jgi:hypothetical protein